MSLKWKIFQFLNWLVLIPAVILMVYYLPEILKRSGQDRFFTIILFLQFSGVAFNNCTNLYVINHYFPGKLLTKGTKRLFIFSLALDILAFITAFAAIVILLQDEIAFTPEYYQISMLVLCCLSLFVILTVYFNIIRFQIGKHLQKENTINKMIEDIGREDPSLSGTN